MARARVRTPRLTAVHARSGNPDRLVRATHFARCGKRIYKVERSTGVSGYSFALVANSAMLDRAVTCAACRRWLDMTPEDRDAHDSAAALKRSLAFAKLKVKANVARQERAIAEVLTIAELRDDAQVALDALLSGIEYPRMAEVLAAAMLAHRRANPSSRGERLWLFAPHPAETVAARLDAGTRERRIACRFCRSTIGVDELGRDYSDSYFKQDEFGAWRRCFHSDEDSVSISRHTAICSLVYLGDLAHPDGEKCPAYATFTSATMNGDGRARAVGTRCTRSLGHPGEHEFPPIGDA